MINSDEVFKIGSIIHTNTLNDSNTLLINYCLLPLPYLMEVLKLIGTIFDMNTVINEDIEFST